MTGHAPIRLLHVYQNSNVGGIQQQLLSLFREYDRSVVEPVFCSLGPRGEIGSELERLGIDFVPLGRGRSHRTDPSIVLQLADLMRKRRIQVLRTHKYRANLYGRIAAVLAGVPVRIASFHGNYRKDKRLARRMMNRLLAPFTDRFVAVSESIREDIVRYDGIEPSRVVVIRNGVDTGRFQPLGAQSPLRKEFAGADNAVVVGTIARFVPAKGLAYLIEAVSILRASVPGIRVVLVGEGSLRNDLERRASDLGLGGQIVFTGMRRDINDVLNAFDVFVMPSTAEGLPNALLEAMSAARPIVATPVGGIPEVIRDRANGLLVPARNAAALADAIRELIADPERAASCGSAARRDIVDHYSIKATARTWETLYRTLVASKGGDSD